MISLSWCTNTGHCSSWIAHNWRRHRAINMGKRDSERRLDFVSISAHKMYAPYGGGALVGPKEFFGQTPPAYRGGGTIEVVTLDEVHWAEPPERYEAGSPNVPGAVAMAASMQILSQVGMDTIAEHERDLTPLHPEQTQRTTRNPDLWIQRSKPAG
jgi:selenocysteine lyase/cysteine desulfurase